MLASLLWCFICAALVDWLRRHTSLLWQRISYAGCGALLLMLASALGPMWYFRKRGWLK